MLANCQDARGAQPEAILIWTRYIVFLFCLTAPDDTW